MERKQRDCCYDKFTKEHKEETSGPCICLSHQALVIIVHRHFNCMHNYVINNTCRSVGVWHILVLCLWSCSWWTSLSRIVVIVICHTCRVWQERQPEEGRAPHTLPNSTATGESTFTSPRAKTCSVQQKVLSGHGCSETCSANCRLLAVKCVVAQWFDCGAARNAANLLELHCSTLEGFDASACAIVKGFIQGKQLPPALFIYRACYKNKSV